jgi:hypothetical protein
MLFPSNADAIVLDYRLSKTTFRTVDQFVDLRSPRVFLIQPTVYIYEIISCSIRAIIFIIKQFILFYDAHTITHIPVILNTFDVSNSWDLAFS